MASIDDRFRLRRFVERLAAEGEALRIAEPVDLADLARDIESRPQASWYQSVGPDKLEMVAAVSASRRRLAMAFDTDERQVTSTIAKRLAMPQHENRIRQVRHNQLTDLWSASPCPKV